MLDTELQGYLCWAKTQPTDFVGCIVGRLQLCKGRDWAKAQPTDLVGSVVGKALALRRAQLG
ncbi:hypothetical protein CWC31_02620 [Pseudoalteromonas ruthenica]|nr:hypothetical protein CWC31_02620 [Pseudoalteromonas ruthenica]